MSIVLVHVIDIIGKWSIKEKECSLENQGAWSLIFLLNATEKWNRWRKFIVAFEVIVSWISVQKTNFIEISGKYLEAV